MVLLLLLLLLLPLTPFGILKLRTLPLTFAQNTSTLCTLRPITLKPFPWSCTCLLHSSLNNNVSVSWPPVHLFCVTQDAVAEIEEIKKRVVNQQAKMKSLVSCDCCSCVYIYCCRWVVVVWSHVSPSCRHDLPLPDAPMLYSQLVIALVLLPFLFFVEPCHVA